MPLEPRSNPPASRKRALAPVFLLYRYCTWLERWRRPILWFSLMTSILGAFFSARLYMALRTDIEELLPETAQSVKDLTAVTGRVGGLNHISVVIESGSREAGRKFARDMATRLRGLPTSLVARVQDGIQEERAFFEKNKALYIDLTDWEDMSRYVRARIRYEKRSKGPFSLGLEEAEDRPQFDFEALKKKYAERASRYDRFPDGIFESRDGRTRVVLAFLPGKVTDIGSNQRLSEAAHRIAAELGPASYAADLKVGFDGDVQNIVEEHAGLIEDLVKSFVLVSLMVGLAMILYFKCLAGVLALCSSLFAGVAWTFGLSYWVVGYLNANTAFLGSIVVGNGINCGIILLARYLEERRGGMAARDSLFRAVGFTTQATWTAAIAAGLSYLSLVLTDFRGFSQFGVIGGLGMALCWLSSFTTLPALLLWVESRGWLRVRVGEARPVVARLVSRGVIASYRPLFALTVVSAVLAGVMAGRLSQDTLESDFSKLRNRESMLHGSGYWGDKVDAVFGRYLTPTVVLTTDPADSAKVADALERLRVEEGKDSPIAEVKRVEDFLPKDAGRKIRVIDEIRGRLSPEVIKRLSAEDRKLVDDILPKAPLRPLSLSDLPTGLTYHFREIDGAIGTMVHVFPKLPPHEAVAGKDAGFWNGREVIRFAEKIRQAVREAGVAAAIAGQPPLSADMISAISTDGPKATAAAFLAVVALVLLVFPRWELFRSILAALLLGVLWLFGIMGAFNLKINFLNFIALPITFGIGVDYAVNIFSRYRLDRSRSIGRVIEHTGGAVALCSLTTIIGYSSLLLAGSQAFVSFGLLAVLGELTCITAAIIALPAAWHFFEERTARRNAR